MLHHQVRQAPGSCHQARLAEPGVVRARGRHCLDRTQRRRQAEVRVRNLRLHRVVVARTVEAPLQQHQVA